MEEVTTLFDSDEAENEYMKEREEKEKPDYIDRAHYCKHICKCNREKCDRSACPIWSAPSADVVPRAEVARKIFEEIEKHECSNLFGKTNLYMLTAEEFAELKKKHTGEE